MNVIEQVGNVALSTVMQDAWARGQKVTVHGWVYGLKDGLVKDLQVSMDRSPTRWSNVFRNALKRYPRAWRKRACVTADRRRWLAMFPTTPGFLALPTTSPKR